MPDPDGPGAGASVLMDWADTTGAVAMMVRATVVEVNRVEVDPCASVVGTVNTSTDCTTVVLSETNDGIVKWS